MAVNIRSRLLEPLKTLFLDVRVSFDMYIMESFKSEDPFRSASQQALYV